jgi:hypothetical protein
VKITDVVVIPRGRSGALGELVNFISRRILAVSAGLITAAGVATAVPSAALAAGTSLTFDAPPVITAGAIPVEFSGTLDNTSGPDLTGVRYDITLDGPADLQADQIDLEYVNETGGWQRVPLSGTGTVTGFFGPETGFDVPAGATNVTDFRLGIDPTAPGGPVTTTVVLEVPGSGSPDALASATTTIYHPTLTVNPPATLTNDSTPGDLTLTVDNSGGEALPEVGFGLTITGDPGLTADELQIAYPDGSGGWTPVSMSGSTTAGGAITGSFAAPAPLPASAPSVPVPLQIAVDSGAPTGSITITAALLQEDGAGTVVDTIASASGTTDIAAPSSTPPPPSGTVTTTVPDGGTGSSAPAGTTPSAATPVIASVTSPNGGTVSFTPAGAGAAQPGYTMLGHSFVITAPAASASDPLRLTFQVDDATLPAGSGAAALTVFRDGAAIPACATAGATTADPDPCVASRDTADGVTTITVLSSHASTWAFGANLAGCTSAPFADVSVSSAFCGDIAWLKTQQIAQGYADGGFHPAVAVSRQAMAAFLYRSANAGKAAPACTSAPFADVSVSSAFCGDIAWLKTQQIAQGYADGGFHPAVAVSRQAMAAFLYRSAS